MSEKPENPAVEVVARAMLVPLGYKANADWERIWVGDITDSPETGSLAYLCRDLAQAAITAIRSASPPTSEAGDGGLADIEGHPVRDAVLLLESVFSYLGDQALPSHVRRFHDVHPRLITLPTASGERETGAVLQMAQALYFDHVDQHGYPNGLPTWDEMPDRIERRIDNLTQRYWLSMAEAALATTEQPTATGEDGGERVAKLEAENANLKQSVITFCAPHAVRYAKEFGLADGELHPVHYDILAKCGGRMDDFTRADRLSATGGGQDD